MSYHNLNSFGATSAGEDSPKSSHMDYRSHMSSVGMPEPVTPPASAHSSVLYSNTAHYFTHPKSLPSKTQYSPSLSTRDQMVPSAYNNTFVGSLASPVETPLGGSLSSNSSSYVNTPHTPFGSNLSNEGLPPTPSTSGSLNLNRGHSIPGAGPLPGISPVGHSRSYSYNLVDLQPGMSRMSLSNSIGSGGSSHVIPQDREPRPRAYSSSLASNISPLIGGGNAAGGQQQDLSSGLYSFSVPHAQQMNSENMLAANNILHQRSQYAQSFGQPVAEDTFALGGTSKLAGVGGSPRMGLHRSMSSISSSGSVGIGGSGSLLASASSSSQFDEGSNLNNSGSSALSMGHNMGKKLNSAQKRGSIPRQRRSSSGASSASVESASGSVNNAGIAADNAINNTLPGVKGQPGANIDIATADDEQIYSLCKDQRGCRFLQRKLTESDATTIRRVFDATYEHIVTLMMDPFGNYFCQKLFEYCSQEQISQLLNVAAPCLPTIAINQHGTRALQKLIDGITKPEQVNIVVSALDGHVVRLIRDLNGNHVIQKLLLDLDDRGSQFIYDAVCVSVVEIGSHRHGCCVLQRCLDYAHDFNRHKLVAHIVSQALVLVCDPFGNYVCQYVIDLGVQEYTDSLVQQLLGKIAALSVQKFSSNVVEKCLRAASPELQRMLVSEVMMPKTLHELLLDNYGNYVIQTALESSTTLDTMTKQQLSLSVQSALATTRSPYGRRIMSKLKSW